MKTPLRRILLSCLFFHTCQGEPQCIQIEVLFWCFTHGHAFVVADQSPQNVRATFRSGNNDLVFFTFLLQFHTSMPRPAHRAVFFLQIVSYQDTYSAKKMVSTASESKQSSDLIARTSPRENSAPPVLFSFALNLDKLTPIFDATSSCDIDLARISPFNNTLFICTPPFTFTRYFLLTLRNNVLLLRYKVKKR